MAAPTIVLRPDVPEEVTSRFSGINGISGIVVKPSGQDEYEILIYLSRFDSSVRRCIYAQEREIYEKFPDVSLDFIVVDSSETDDAANDTTRASL
jgi:hypothetical protein